MSKPLIRPKRKNPLERTRLPLLPHGQRSRTAHGLTLAAAQGRFALQVCNECSKTIYPPRDACPFCLGAQQHPAAGGNAPVLGLPCQQIINL